MNAESDDAVMMTREVRILNKLGLHARPAAVFARTAARFGCDIFVQKHGEKVNGKSLIGLLMLAAGQGSRLTLHAHGPDASLALAELGMLFERQFGEKEQEPLADGAFC